jgi:hypothetical protein
MYIINRKLFEQRVTTDPKLAYLLIRAIEHPCSTDQYPTHEMTELREHLVTLQVANRVGAMDTHEPEKIEDNDPDNY